VIVLDTNIVSAFMSGPPPPEVLTWLNDQDAATLHLTTISIGEVEYGLRILPDGKRRRLLAERFEQFVAAAFQTRILSFDEAAARAYGEVRGRRKELGRPMSTLDGQIAAIARSRGFALATRNVKDFEHCEIALINPFSTAH
jgi:predicted nucleic acid-binding protein